MITHLVEIAPADTIANDDGHGHRVTVLHRCPSCGVQHRELLPSGRWTLGHDHDGTWTVRRSGRLLVACSWPPAWSSPATARGTTAGCPAAAASDHRPTAIGEAWRHGWDWRKDVGDLCPAHARKLTEVTR